MITWGSFRARDPFENLAAWSFAKADSEIPRSAATDSILFADRLKLFRGVKFSEWYVNKMAELSDVLKGSHKLPKFSIRAKPIPPVIVSETEQIRPETRASGKVDDASMMELMAILKDNLEALKGNKASKKGAMMYKAQEIVSFAKQLGIPTKGRKKEENVMAIKTKMREHGFITDVNV